jgi:hypothetical protein
MRIPEQPAVNELTHLSPSLYEAARACKARAAWAAFGDRGRVPAHPRALLGTCVHAVLEEAHHGRLPSGEDEACREAARRAFDQKAKELYDAAHPLIRVKFASPERIPYYYLFRERAAVLALATAPRSSAGGGPAASAAEAGALPAALVETTLRSRDGLLLGRPDYVDAAASEVVDYKTGAGPDDDPDGLRDSEARQLRLYVYLARERGLQLRRGVVVRVDGRRVALDVGEPEAAAEAQRARETLSDFNAKASAGGFKALAQPSPDACRYCPCIPFCEAFWEAAAPAWHDQCGAHVEGRVSAVNKAVVQDTALLTLELTAERGTVTRGPAVVQQLPATWVCADGATTPAVGDVVRVVNCRLADNASETTLIRPERLTTAVWSVPSAERSGSG